MSVLTINLVYSQSLLDEYPKAFIVNADNVGSKQMQQIRQALRGKASMCLLILESFGFINDNAIIAIFLHRDVCQQVDFSSYLCATVLQLF